MSHLSSTAAVGSEASSPRLHLPIDNSAEHEQNPLAAISGRLSPPPASTGSLSTITEISDEAASEASDVSEVSLPILLGDEYQGLSLIDFSRKFNAKIDEAQVLCNNPDASLDDLKEMKETLRALYSKFLDSNYEESPDVSLPLLEALTQRCDYATDTLDGIIKNQEDVLEQKPYAAIEHLAKSIGAARTFCEADHSDLLEELHEALGIGQDLVEAFDAAETLMDQVEPGEFERVYKNTFENLVNYFSDANNNLLQLITRLTFKDNQELIGRLQDLLNANPSPEALRGIPKLIKTASIVLNKVVENTREMREHSSPELDRDLLDTYNWIKDRLLATDTEARQQLHELENGVPSEAEAIPSEAPPAEAASVADDATTIVSSHYDIGICPFDQMIGAVGNDFRLIKDLYKGMSGGNQDILQSKIHAQFSGKVPYEKAPIEAILFGKSPLAAKHPGSLKSAIRAAQSEINKQ